jgi:hypothetical protein
MPLPVLLFVTDSGLTWFALSQWQKFLNFRSRVVGSGPMPDGYHYEFSPTRSPVLQSRDMLIYQEPAKGPRDRVWRWTLRLALPVLVFLSGLILYWIWFDSAYGIAGWKTVIVGLPLAVEAAAVALWSVGAWCSEDLV